MSSTRLLPKDYSTQAPILASIDHHFYEEDLSVSLENCLNVQNSKSKPEDEIWERYEIERTIRELVTGGWKRVALQFPDDMLGDAGAVVKSLEMALERHVSSKKNKNSDATPKPEYTELGHVGLGQEFITSNNGVANKEKVELAMPIIISKSTSMDLGDGGPETNIINQSISNSTDRPAANKKKKEGQTRFYVLADTSYGSCCVDEIAAEHVNAQVIIHYGRSCLSPTVRLPVLYIFTTPSLNLDAVFQDFQKTFEEKNENVILMADIMYHRYIQFILERLVQHHYTNIIAPEVVHDPASIIPNRRIGSEVDLKKYSIFHISEPPPALLLTLSSRVQDLYIFPTSQASISISPSQTIRAITSSVIRRRYALVNSLNTCSIFGILINTLSVKHYLRVLEEIQALIRSAGKKYYTFVIGKINAAKMANFSEVGGWIVVGCWESSLIESKDFYRPIITPWELEWVLTDEKVRIWTGEWRGDFEAIGKMVHDSKDEYKNNLANNSSRCELAHDDKKYQLKQDTSPDFCSSTLDESESEPPEFDLRTGRYVAHARPLQVTGRKQTCTALIGSTNLQTSQALSHRHKGTLVKIGNEMSPGAHFLKNNRTWTGLGSDFHEDDATDTLMEIGRAGVARGYVVGDGFEEKGREHKTER